MKLKLYFSLHLAFTVIALETTLLEKKHKSLNHFGKLYPDPLQGIYQVYKVSNTLITVSQSYISNKFFPK